MLDVKHLDVEYITNAAGQKTAVIIPINQFEELIEDIDDLAAVAERREVLTIAHSDFISQLKRVGLL